MDTGVAVLRRRGTCRLRTIAVIPLVQLPSLSMKVYIVHSSDPADLENPFKAWMVVAATMTEAAGLVPDGLVVSGIEFRRHEVPESLETPQLLGWVGSKLPLVDPDDAPALLN